MTNYQLVATNDTYNFAIILGADGKLYKSGVSEEITDPAITSHLSFNGGTWTMSGLNFETSSVWALTSESSVAITIDGTNTLIAGNEEGAFGIFAEDRSLTLQGAGTLNLTSRNSETGMALLVSNLTIDGITLNAISGDCQSVSMGLYVAGNLDVKSGTVTAVGGSGADSAGIFALTAQVASGATLVAQGETMGCCSGNTITVDGTNPAVIYDASGNALTWDGEEGTYVSGGTIAKYVTNQKKAPYKDYGLYLSNGTIYKDNSLSTPVTDTDVTSAFFCNGDTWTMNNLTFHTTWYAGLNPLDNTTTILVSGDNLIAEHCEDGNQVLYATHDLTLQGVGDNATLALQVVQNNNISSVTCDKALTVDNLTINITAGTVIDKAALSMLEPEKIYLLNGAKINVTVTADGKAYQGAELTHCTVTSSEGEVHHEGLTYVVNDTGEAAKQLTIVDGVHYTLTDASTIGSVTFTVGGTVATWAYRQDTVYLSAATVAGYNFVDYTINGAKTYDNYFTMPAENVTVVANYQATEYTLTSASSLGEQGGVTFTVDGIAGATSAHIGQTVALTAVEVAGYTFTGFASTDVTIENNQFTMPAKAVTVTASYTATEYTLTSASSLGEQGGVTFTVDGIAGATSAHIGQTVALTAVEVAGYTFTGFTSTDVTIENNQFTMPAKAVTVTANYAPAVVYKDYGLYLSNGTIYKDNGLSTPVTDTDVTSAFFCNGDTWTMNNLTFQTTWNSALIPYDDATTILVSGDNLISEHFESGNQVLYAEHDLTLQGVGDNATLALQMLHNDYTCDVEIRDALTLDNLTINITADTVIGNAGALSLNKPTKVSFRNGSTINVTVTAEGIAYYGKEATHCAVTSSEGAIHYDNDRLTYVVNDTGTAAKQLTFTDGVHYTLADASTIGSVTFTVDGAVASWAYQQDRVYLSAATVEGYEFQSYSINGVETTDNSFTMPTENVTAVANYQAIEYTLTSASSLGEAGGVTFTVDGIAGATSAHIGQTVALTAVEVAGYTFTGFTSTDVTIENNQFTMPAKDVTVTANYAPSVTYTLTLDPSSVNVSVGGTSGLVTAKVTDQDGNEYTITNLQFWGETGFASFNPQSANTFTVTAGESTGDRFYGVSATLEGGREVSAEFLVTIAGADYTLYLYPSSVNISEVGGIETVNAHVIKDGLEYTITDLSFGECEIAFCEVVREEGVATGFTVNATSLGNSGVFVTATLENGGSTGAFLPIAVGSTVTYTLILDPSSVNVSAGGTSDLVTATVIGSDGNEYTIYDLNIYGDTEFASFDKQSVNTFTVTGGQSGSTEPQYYTVVATIENQEVMADFAVTVVGSGYTLNLNPSNVYIYVGESQNVGATVMKEGEAYTITNLTFQECEFANFAEVREEGVLTGFTVYASKRGDQTVTVTATLANGDQVHASLDLSVSAAPADYTLYLCTNGELRKNSADGEIITDTSITESLYFQENAWIMQGLRFTTTAAVGVITQSDATITINGFSQIAVDNNTAANVIGFNGGASSITFNGVGEESMLNITMMGLIGEAGPDGYYGYYGQNVAFSGAHVTVTLASQSSNAVALHVDGNLTADGGSLGIYAQGASAIALQVGGNATVATTTQLQMMGQAKAYDSANQIMSDASTPAVLYDANGQSVTWDPDQKNYIDVNGNVATQITNVGGTATYTLNLDPSSVNLTVGGSDFVGTTVTDGAGNFYTINVLAFADCDFARFAEVWEEGVLTGFTVNAVSEGRGSVTVTATIQNDDGQMVDVDAQLFITVTDAPSEYDFYIRIEGGMLYKNDTTEEITEEAITSHLTFDGASNTWTMSGLNFTSTKQYGIYTNENVTITVDGTNSIVSGVGEAGSTTIACTGALTLQSTSLGSLSIRSSDTESLNSVPIACATLTINGLSVNAVSGNSSSHATAISAESMSIINSYITAQSGTSPNDSIAIASNQISIQDSEVTAIAGDGGRNSYGIAVQGTISISDDSIVSGQGGSASTQSAGIGANTINVTQSTVRGVGGSAAQSIGIGALESMSIDATSVITGEGASAGYFGASAIQGEGGSAAKIYDADVNELTWNAQNKVYLNAEKTGAATYVTNLTAKNYSICLCTDGILRKDSQTGEVITDTAITDHLVYNADGIWEMTDLNFSTTATYAIIGSSDETITVNGTNTIVASSNRGDYASAYMSENMDLVLNGSGTLNLSGISNAEAGGFTGRDLTVAGVTLNLSGVGTGMSAGCLVQGNFSVWSGTVTAIGTGAAVNYGLGVLGTSTVATGAVIIAQGDSAGYMGLKAIQDGGGAAAKIYDADGNELTWNSSPETGVGMYTDASGNPAIYVTNQGGAVTYTLTLDPSSVNLTVGGSDVVTTTVTDGAGTQYTITDLQIPKSGIADFAVVKEEGVPTGFTVTATAAGEESVTVTATLANGATVEATLSVAVADPQPVTYTLKFDPAAVNLTVGGVQNVGTTAWGSDGQEYSITKLDFGTSSLAQIKQLTASTFSVTAEKAGAESITVNATLANGETVDAKLALNVVPGPGAFYCSTWTEKQSINVTWHGKEFSGTVGDGTFFNVYSGAKTKVASTSDFIVVLESSTLTSVQHYDAQNVYLSCDDAVYNRMILAGELISGSHEYTGSYTVNIEGGTYMREVAGGDASNKYVDRTGNITLNISGGVFVGHVLGGSYYSAKSATGSAVVVGDINFTVSGGVFEQRVYGGCGSISEEMSSRAAMAGNVYLTIDASANAIDFQECVAAGNRGYGLLLGSTNVTVTGLGSNLTFADSSVLFGGCGGDYYSTDSGVREAVTSVVDPTTLEDPGVRALTFSNFTGDFNAEIRMFSDITFDDSTLMNFADANLDLKEIETWNFDCTSFASNLNKNQFTGDTINVDTTALTEGSWTLLSGSESAFADLGSAASVTLGGATATYSGTAWTTDNFSLSVEDQTKLVISKLA